MRNIQIESISGPFRGPEIARLATETLNMASAMGLLPPNIIIRELAWEPYQESLKAIASAGVATGPFAEACSGPAPEEPAQVLQLLKTIASALEDSPVPEKEWSEQIRILGIDRIVGLLGVSPSSVRRYVEGKRQTPQAVATRLHFITLLVGDLAGAYNDFGIRRWFERPRKLLDGHSPEELLVGEWKPEDEGPTKVHQLARSLASAIAT